MSDASVAALHHDTSLRGTVSEGEWETRVQLAAAFRVASRLGWNFGIRNHMAARIPDAPGYFLINAASHGWHEITASSLLKYDLECNLLTDTERRPGPAGLNIHGAILRLKAGLHCTMHVHEMSGVVVSAMDEGLMYFDQDACSLFGEVCYHDFGGLANAREEGERIVGELGERHAMIMRNHGLLTAGRSIAEAWWYMKTLVRACEVQVKLMSTGARRRPVSQAVLEHTCRQMAGRQQGQPRGELEYRMVLRYAEQLDPGFKR